MVANYLSTMVEADLTEENDFHDHTTSFRLKYSSYRHKRLLRPPLSKVRGPQNGRKENGFRT